MVGLPQLWLPIVLTAVLVFVASSLIHMVLKWHNADYGKFANEPEVMDAVRKGSPAPGQYIFPHTMEGDLKREEAVKKLEQGPVGLVYLRAPGAPQMGKFLGSWFAFNLVVALFVAYLASRTLPAGTHYLRVFRVVGAASFLAHAAGAVPDAIWMGKPWAVTLKQVGDGLIYALVTAGAFGWLWPR